LDFFIDSNVTHLSESELQSVCLFTGPIRYISNNDKNILIDDEIYNIIISNNPPEIAEIGKNQDVANNPPDIGATRIT
jgi:hypothetical protein